jgi:hypothetical protein
VKRTLVSLALLLVAPFAKAQDIPQFEGPPPAPEPPRPPPPPEAPAPRFGEAGETIIGGDTGGGLVSSSYDGSSAKQTSAGFALDLRHFVARDFAVGIYLQASASESRGYGADGSLVRTRRDLLSGGVTLGYNVPLGAALSFFPSVVLGVHRSHRNIAVESGTSASISASASGADDVAHTGPWVHVVLPLLVHPVPHFFIGIGPSFYRDTAAEVSGAGVSGRRASIGLDLQLGGWWGGPRVDAPSPGGGRRFGDQDVLVLSNETSLGAAYSWYSGTDAWDAGVSISPGVDYFVAPHVSIGAVGYFSHSETVGFSGTTRVKTTWDTYGIGPRLGAELPITTWLSAYLRGGLIFGHSSFDESTARAKNAGSYGGTRVFATLHAVVHAASHFFVGVGPTFGHDLSSTDQYERSNRQTAIGASAIVGGWL